jgi:1,4-alpha-glucan branching enzyme
VALCGEFNDWSAEATQLERSGDESWPAAIALEPGRSYRYRYRYLLDGSAGKTTGRPIARCRMLWAASIR